ncbi:hypothetical protein DID76_01010 [Candidatus Marinamargulisbacteria bacterium SCGC AG-414-C22]|nr:hypothetical protein DID76_01010 [Candidatus Marinamargulisbacteria bacterium SCGC AG-414-C22]
MKTISILGCGWLGLPLGESLSTQNKTIKGSYQSSETHQTLTQTAIKPYYISCQKEITGKQVSDFFTTDLLIITLPFKRSFNPAELYLEQINSIITMIKKQNIPNVIFTSSTSIYPTQNNIVTEATPIQPSHERQHVLHDVEQSLLNITSCQTTILRLAGLYGKSRKIGQFFKPKKNKINPHAQINLIHLTDVINIITQLIKSPLKNTIFNLCSDEHPTKLDCYSYHNTSLTAADFNTNNNTPYKIVCNKKIKNTLNYIFKYPNPRSPYE